MLFPLFQLDLQQLNIGSFEFSEQIFCLVLGYSDRKSRRSANKVTSQCRWSRSVISVKQPCRYGEDSRYHLKMF